MRNSRLASVVCALVLVTSTVACGASSEEAPPPGSADAAWAETTSTLGVTSWAMVPSDDDSSTLTGFDDAHTVRSQFVLGRGRDDAGNVIVRVRSVIQGPAELEYRALPDQKIEILKDTFRDHPDAKRALSLAEANLGGSGGAAVDGPLVSGSSVHVLDTPLVGNQQQLICKDARGNACQKPPDMGGATGVGAGCVAGAVGLAGAGCLLSGFETIGFGCVVSAVGAAYGAYTCADGLAQRANCTCVTPCAQQCHQTFNRQYACPSNNTASCSNAVANDRVQEASCVRACGG